jgi:hypothetical protein
LVNAARNDPSPEPGDEQYADSYYCREAAITALAKYWPAEEIALECLRDVSQTDEVEWMRSAAAAWLSSITTGVARAAPSSLPA